MFATRTLPAGATIALVVLSLAAPAAASGYRAWTQDGQCVHVDDSTSPPTATQTTGCTEDDPCVYVNWTTTPPTVAVGEYCS